MRAGFAVLAIATAACGLAADAIADGTVELDTPAATTDAGPPLEDIGQIDLDSDGLCAWAEDATGGNIGDVRRGASHGTLPDGRVVVEPDYPNPSHELSKPSPELWTTPAPTRPNGSHASACHRSKGLRPNVTPSTGKPANGSRCPTTSTSTPSVHSPTSSTPPADRRLHGTGGP